MKDKACIWLAWLLPRRLVYWCAVRVGAHASQGQWMSEVVPAISMMTALDRWNKQ